MSAGKAKGGALDMCKALLEEFRVEGSMYQMGKTRLFFRAGVLGHLEDTWARIQRSALPLVLSPMPSFCSLVVVLPAPAFKAFFSRIPQVATLLLCCLRSCHRDQFKQCLSMRLAFCTATLQHVAALSVTVTH